MNATENPEILLYPGVFADIKRACEKPGYSRLVRVSFARKNGKCERLVFKQFYKPNKHLMVCITFENLLRVQKFLDVLKDVLMNPYYETRGKIKLNGKTKMARLTKMIIQHLTQVQFIPLS